SLGARTPLESLSRFGEGVSIAIERGTPLAEVLRAQAQDARENAKRDLMEMAGQREIAMLVPVVFFVLPLVILFAIFPGLAVLEIALWAPDRYRTRCRHRPRRRRRLGPRPRPSSPCPPSLRPRPLRSAPARALTRTRPPRRPT